MKSFTPRLTQIKLRPQLPVGWHSQAYGKHDTGSDQSGSHAPACDWVRTRSWYTTCTFPLYVMLGVACPCNNASPQSLLRGQEGGYKHRLPMKSVHEDTMIQLFSSFRLFSPVTRQSITYTKTHHTQFWLYCPICHCSGLRYSILDTPMEAGQVQVSMKQLPATK